MNNELSALDTSEYRAWIGELKKRYRATQIKAAVSVNSALIEYYWGLGRDISEKYSEFTKSEIYGKQFFQRLSADLKDAMPGVTGHSTQNLRYCLNFYELYAGVKIFPQVVGKCTERISPQLVGKSCDFANATETERNRTISLENILPQVVAKLVHVPWGHHRYIIDKHALNTPEDHEPIGLLICRDHNRILAQYMMDELKTPLGITDYELHCILPPVEKLQAALEEGGSRNV